MKLTKELLKRRIDVAAKRQPADLVVRNGRIVNVFTREIIQDSIAIVDGYIAGIGDYEGLEIIDAAGKFIVPGLIDGHVHIESAMVTPAQFSNVVLPHGVTTIIADPHEIANVSGTEGIHFMLQASENIPLDVYIMLPSCVPATPFENAGASLAHSDLEPFYDHPRVLGLGEVMDFPSVFNTNDGMLSKIVNAKLKGKCIDGHASGLHADGINVYMSAGIRTDHECVSAEEALERLRKGMYVMLREGSAAKDLVELLKAVNEHNARRCLFVTDDKHLDEVVDKGSIDFNIKTAIENGIDPLLAIQMATLNAAECFGLKTKGAVAPGYEADFLVVNHLNTMDIEQVFKSGKLVAENGSVLSPFRSKANMPSSIINSVNLEPIKSDHLEINIENGSKANIIEILPNMIVTKHIIEEVTADNDLFQTNIERDQLKLAVLERHKKTGNIGLGIIKGLGIKNGAIASTVAHDSHNIVAAGTNDLDLVNAINVTREINGGLVISQNGEILASLPLPVSGLMSDLDYKTVYEKIKRLNQCLIAIGCSMKFNPFVTLSFLALPVIPELKLTDMGLFDVKTFKHIGVKAD